METDYIQQWVDGNWIKAAFGPYTDLLGEPAVVTILGGCYVLSLYWYSRSIYPPAVVLAFYVSLFVFRAPGPVATIGGLIVTIALALAFMAFYRGGKAVR